MEELADPKSRLDAHAESTNTEDQDQNAKQFSASAGRYVESERQNKDLKLSSGHPTTKSIVLKKVMLHC